MLGEVGTAFKMIFFMFLNLAALWLIFYVLCLSKTLSIFFVFNETSNQHPHDVFFLPNRPSFMSRSQEKK